jgi:hypothetical protein
MMFIDECLESYPGMLETLSDAGVQVFFVQNIYEYVRQHVRAPWDSALEGMSVRPPYEHVWLEYRAVHPDGKPMPSAMMLSCYAPSPEELTTARQSFEGIPLSRARWTMLAQMYAGVRTTQATIATLDMSRMALSFAHWLAALPEEPAHLICGQMFAPMESSPGTGKPYAYALLFAALDERGRALVVPTNTAQDVIDGDEYLGAAGSDPLWMVVPLVPPWVRERDGEEWARRASRAAHAVWTIALWSCAFLHCRNVALDAHRPDDKLQRARIRRKKIPFVAYKTLRVVAPGESRTHDGAGESLPYQGVMPIHLVRGHFAHYSEERPLFGRYSGTFWIPAHVRGNREVGTVLKDYRVEVAAMGGETQP